MINSINIDYLDFTRYDVYHGFSVSQSDDRSVGQSVSQSLSQSVSQSVSQPVRPFAFSKFSYSF